MHSEELNELFNGMMLFRAQLQQPKKDANNPFFKSGYVTLEGVIKAVDDALKGTGLAYFQSVHNLVQGVGVETIVTHKSGQFFSTGVLALTPEKKNPQGYGSAITYAKRYQLAAFFGVSSDTDDDANGATPSNNPNGGYQRRQQPQQARSKEPEMSQHDKDTITNTNNLAKVTLEKLSKNMGVEYEVVHKQAQSIAKTKLKAGMSKKEMVQEYLRAAELLATQYAAQVK